MNWIILSEYKINKDDVSALKYKAETEQSAAELLIYLRGGSEIRLSDEDAAAVWEAFDVDQSSDV